MNCIDRIQSTIIRSIRRWEWEGRQEDGLPGLACRVVVAACRRLLLSHHAHFAASHRAPLGPFCTCTPPQPQVRHVLSRACLACGILVGQINKATDWGKKAGQNNPLGIQRRYGLRLSADAQRARVKWFTDINLDLDGRD